MLPHRGSPLSKTRHLVLLLLPPLAGRAAESVLDYWQFKVLVLRFDLLRKSNFIELLHRTCSLVHFVYSTPHLPKSAVSTILYNISKILYRESNPMFTHRGSPLSKTRHYWIRCFRCDCCCSYSANNYRMADFNCGIYY